MRITHKIPRFTVSKERCDTSLCILANRLGSFFLVSADPFSKYQGVFFNDKLEVYKVMEDICLVDSRPSEIENQLTRITRVHKDNSEKISFPTGANGISYALAKKAGISISLDCRKVDDMRAFGRIYRTEVKGKNIIVSFTKQTDSREDSTHEKEEFQLFIVVQPKSFDKDSDFRQIEEWKEVQYSYDRERNDPPTSRYTYTPFMINAKELLIGFGTTEEQAIAEIDKLKRQKQAKQEFRTTDKKKDADTAAAFICAQDSLDKLRVLHEDKERLFAGYPWFFQFWSRDENVSLGALIRTGQYSTVKNILFEYLKNIGPDGRLANRIPSSELGSADGVGWFWKRVRDFIESLEELHQKEKYISSKDLKDIRTALDSSIKNIEKSYMKDGLVTSGINETWMDTQHLGKDGRPGAAIEVQALHLNMLQLAGELAKEPKDIKKYKDKEKAMKKKVLEDFWHTTLLADTADDLTQRPNMFIAYYVYPDLLSRKQWQAAFEHALDRLWLDWGGLSSIDTKHELFTPDYTVNQSYHRGDSWYWINNLAALCMHRNNAIAFEKKIRKIINASTKEMLWSGAIGHCAEVSSASQLNSKGCFAQAWSAAMFIELMMEVQG